MTAVLNYLLSFPLPNIFPFDIDNFEWIPFFVTVIFFFIFYIGSILMLQLIDAIINSSTTGNGKKGDAIGLVFLFLNPISVFYGLFFIDYVIGIVGVIAMLLIVSWMYDDDDDDDDYWDY